MQNIYEFASHDDVRAALNELRLRFPYMQAFDASHAAQGPVIVGLVEIGPPPKRGERFLFDFQPAYFEF